MASQTHQMEYQIQQGNGRKHLDSSPSPFHFKASNIASWTLWLFYIALQFTFVLRNYDISSHWQIFAALLAEIFIALPEILFLLGTTFAIWDLPKSSKARESYRLVGETAPTVDVFVTCAGESIDTVIDTVRAAIAQDYPTTKLRVLLLDDGNDLDLKHALYELVETLRTKPCPTFHYLARPSDNHGFGKAGNLQYGIDWTKGHGSSEFIASLDADMIVEPDWLRRIVPHALLDDAVGLVNPPQIYYNTPDGDPLGSEADLIAQYGVYEPLNDRLGAAICTGTGFVVRRTAIEDMGGWALIVPCDDIMSSTMLNKHGWKVAFVQERVQVGLGPDSWEAAVKQKMRWKAGMLIYIDNFNFFSSDTELSNLSWFQKAAGTIQSLGCYIPLLFVASALLLPLGLWHTPEPPRNLSSEPAITAIRWLFLAAYVGQKINLYIVYGHCGLKTARTLKLTSIWISPYESFVCLKALLRGSGSKHQSLGSIKSPLNERSKSRTSLVHRITSLPIALYSIYAALVLTPLMIQLLRRDGSLFFILPGPMVKTLECLLAALIPVRYMVLPPTMPDREDMLKTDADGVRRPEGKGLKPDNGFSYIDALELLVISWSFGWI